MNNLEMARRCRNVFKGPKQRYCKAFKETSCSCVICYDTGAGAFRGCYEKP